MGAKWKSNPYTFSLDDLRELDIGGTKEQTGGCDYYLADWKKNFEWANGGKKLWPDNGEFDWGNSPGSYCTYCASEGGKECDNGLTNGGRPVVKRVAFKGDPTKCCLANNVRQNQTYFVDGKTCDPRYRKPDSTDCIGAMNNYCAGENIITKPECINWAYADGKNRLMKAFCNSSIENSRKDKCVEWCKQNSTDCTVLNTTEDCIKYGLCDSIANCTANTCSQQKVIDIKTKCKKYGLESEQGLRLGGCSTKGVAAFEKECADYEVDLDSCAFTSLESKKTLKLQAETAAASKAELEKTRNAISKSLGLPEDTQEQSTTTTTDGEKDFFSSQTFGIDNTILIMISMIFIFMLSSSSILSLFATGSKRRSGPQPIYYAPPPPPPQLK